MTKKKSESKTFKSHLYDRIDLSVTSLNWFILGVCCSLIGLLIYAFATV